MDSPQNSFLHLPLSQSGISEALATAAEANGYHTLAEILAIPLTEIVSKDWITKEMWEEIEQIMQRQSPGKPQ